jgi:uncharacterized protein YdbL (DUF1318 family)
LKKVFTSILLLSGVVFGCAPRPEVVVTLIDERTALENQIIGSFEELESEAWEVASLRGVPAEEVPAWRRRVIEAFKVRRFYKDDLEEFKADGSIGENIRGLLSVLETEKMKTNKEYRDLVTRVVQEVNEARIVIMRRIVEIQEGLDEDDMEEVRRIFAKMYQDNAKPGHWIQLPTGEWVRKR